MYHTLALMYHFIYHFTATPMLSEGSSIVLQCCLVNIWHRADFSFIEITFEKTAYAHDESQVYLSQNKFSAQCASGFSVQVNIKSSTLVVVSFLTFQAAATSTCIFMTIVTEISVIHVNTAPVTAMPQLLNTNLKKMKLSRKILKYSNYRLKHLRRLTYLSQHAVMVKGLLIYTNSETCMMPDTYLAIQVIKYHHSGD